MKSFISAFWKAGVVAVFAVVLSFGFKGAENADDLPQLKIKVVQDMAPNQGQDNAEVEVKIAGTNTVVASGLTQGGGMFSEYLQAGYYDIRVWYPARPNNQQSGQKLNHYHYNQNLVTIMLSPPY
jgi:hypothetical protein